MNKSDTPGRQKKEYCILLHKHTYKHISLSYTNHRPIRGIKIRIQIRSNFHWSSTTINNQLIIKCLEHWIWSWFRLQKISPCLESADYCWFLFVILCQCLSRVQWWRAVSADTNPLMLLIYVPWASHLDYTQAPSAKQTLNCQHKSSKWVISQRAVGFVLEGDWWVILSHHFDLRVINFLTMATSARAI